MSNRILVAYATALGSTTGVAEAIAETLREGGAEVDVSPVQDVTDLSPYSAFVVGSAVQASTWLPEGVEFVKAHQAELSQKPFAAFVVCMTMAMKNKKWVENAEVQKFLDDVRAVVTPNHEGYFAGVLDIKRIPHFWARFGFRISVWTGVWKEGDHRDWDAIRAWAREIAPKLSPRQA